MKEHLQNMAEQLDVIDQPSIYPPSEVETEERNIATVYVILVDEEDETKEQLPDLVEGSIEDRTEDGERSEEESTDREQAAPSEEQSYPLTWEYPLWATVAGISSQERFLWVRIISVFGLIIWLGPAVLVAVFSSVFALPVIVKLQPVTHEVELETAIRLLARQLSAPTLSQSKTVAATGKGYQSAKAASGLVTLYNALPTAQYVEAGTLLTGSSGIQVMLDQGVTIEGAVAPTMGQASVLAHTMISGATANIRAFDINGPCCKVYMLAKNTAAFTGGQDERHYQTVAVTDIEQAATNLQVGLQSNVQAFFSTQMQGGEALIGPACEPQVRTDKQVGDEAKAVKITVEMTCKASAYSKEELQQTVEQKLDQDATKQLGSSYQRREIQLEVQQSQFQERTVILQIKATGSYDYQFNQKELEYLKASIAGKSRTDASSWLHRQPGIAQVTIDQEQIPPTPTSIRFILMSGQ